MKAKKKWKIKRKKLQNFFYESAFMEMEQSSLIKVAYFMLNFLNLNSFWAYLFFGVAFWLSILCTHNYIPKASAADGLRKNGYHSTWQFEHYQCTLRQGYIISPRLNLSFWLQSEPYDVKIGLYWIRIVIVGKKLSRVRVILVLDCWKLPILQFFWLFMYHYVVKSTMCNDMKHKKGVTAAERGPLLQLITVLQRE